MSNTRSIAIVGVGGQGTVLTSDILIEGLVDLGFDVKKTEQHGLSQQDGSVNCMVKYGDAVYAPIIADGEADVVVAFEKIEALRRPSAASASAGPRSSQRPPPRRPRRRR